MGLTEAVVINIKPNQYRAKGQTVQNQFPTLNQRIMLENVGVS